mmetsp:Transcript_12705/g.19654  ORF Transcript_12705/g.19654 Transcript_12705/m.19654 type:complete len:629 (+) Transcript_12705:117-2003(+)
MKEQLQTTQQLKELCTIIDGDDDNNSMMASSRRLRQVLPDATEYKEEAEEAFHYRPKSKREDDGRGRSSVTKGSRGSSSRQLVVYGEAANSSSSRRHSRSIDKARQHHRSRSAANYKNDDDADRKLYGNGGDNSSRDHQLKKHSSSSSRHHERTRRPPSSEEQSFSSFNTTSTHPSTSNGDDLTVDVDYDDYEDGYGQYTAYESKGPSSRTSSRSSSSSRRKRRSCSPTKSRSRSSRSSSSRHHHHHTHKDEHRSSYSPVRSRRPPRRPSPENYHLRSSFASHGSQRSSRTLPTSSSSSSHHHSSKSAALMRRRSSDDLRALEADDLRAAERAAPSSNRRSGHHRKKSSSSRRKEEPAVDTTVNVRVSRDVKNSSSHSNGSSSRIIDGKTPRKQNHTKSKKKKNSIDLTIDNNGQGTFQVVTSSSTTNSTPLQFDIQIDEVNSSYLIQTSLGLLHHIREVHSPNTNILRTLTHWNQNFERDEVELGYHRGELGIVSMSSKDTKGVVPVPDGVKAKSSTFSNSQDVVLMILTGSYHGGKASSFEKDDVFIKELELFVTDSLWCYLRLHGLMEESSQQQDQDGGDLGNGHVDECAENVRNGSRKNLRAELKNDKKKERVLSRVFKRVIGE